MAKVSGTTYIDKNVEAGKTYYYTVRCMNETGAYFGSYNEVGWSIEIPAAIEADFSLEKTDAGVTLSWAAVDGVAKYRVFRKAEGETKFTALAKITGTSYTDKTVEAGKTYFYYVRCMDDTGAYIGIYNETGKSITIEAVTQADFTVESDSEGVKISWNAVDGAAKYRVMRKAEGETKFTAISKISATSYIDKTVEEGKTYTYTVRCIDANGNYTGSYDKTGKTITYSKPGPPYTVMDLTLKETGSGIQLDWSAVDGVAKYRIMRKAEGETKFTAVAKVSKTTYVDKNVLEGKTYTYAVRCMNESGNYIGSYYNTSIKVHGKTEAIFKFGFDGKGVTISWDAVDGVAKYRVMRRVEGESKFTSLAKISGTSYYDTTVEPEIKYYYTVRCIDASGNYIGTYDEEGRYFICHEPPLEE